MNFYDLNSLSAAMILLSLFIIMCLSVCSLVSSRNRRMPGHKAVLLLCFLVSGIMLVLYSADIRAYKLTASRSPISQWFCNMPVVFSMVMVAAMLLYICFFFFKESSYRAQMPTRSSIKESLDKLSTGLSFSYDNGRVILVNHSMNKLCHSILGTDLHNANTFWKLLQNGDVQPDVFCIKTGDRPVVRLSDGKVWAFACDKLDNIIQIVATDVTQLQEMSEHLHRKNEELEVVNDRLRKYSENVVELTKDKERLETKAYIHRELGKALLVTRQYLVNDIYNTLPPLDVWKKIVTMLLFESEQNSSDTVAMFFKAADAAGVKVELNGKYPTQPTVKNLFVAASIEALVNAVHHANAAALFINIEQNNDECICTFSNDGEPPKKEIVEGGGLSYLRKKIELMGGTMTIESTPQFVLRISAFTERSGNDAPSYDS